MKNIILDGQTYSGISEVSLPISGGTALFKDKDEIIEPTGSLSITANGTYDVADKASAVVNVPAPEINLQTKTATTNGDVVADAGYDGLEKVIVNVSGDVPTLITKTITENGTYPASADNADGFSSVTVNVPAPTPTLQDKTITTNGTYSADEGYDGLGEVVVNVSGGGGIEYQTGSFTVEGDDGTAQATITVELNSAVDNFAFWCTASDAEILAALRNKIIISGSKLAFDSRLMSASYTNSAGTSINKQTMEGIITINGTTVTLGKATLNGYYAGYTYNWKAW